MVEVERAWSPQPGVLAYQQTAGRGQPAVPSWDSGIGAHQADRADVAAEHHYTLAEEASWTCPLCPPTSKHWSAWRWKKRPEEFWKVVPQARDRKHQRQPGSAVVTTRCGCRSQYDSTNATTTAAGPMWVFVVERAQADAAACAQPRSGGQNRTDDLHGVVDSRTWKCRSVFQPLRTALSNWLLPKKHARGQSLFSFSQRPETSLNRASSGRSPRFTGEYYQRFASYSNAQAAWRPVSTTPSGA
jgi:hypothetical protein